jgi:formylglycine-generating enzyme required for sulfatase activity
LLFYSREKTPQSVSPLQFRSPAYSRYIFLMFILKYSNYHPGSDMKPHQIAFIFITIASATMAANSTSGKMVLIPAGSFDMGSVNGNKDERPVHRVQVDSFYIGETEVTIWEYLQCVQSGGCRMPFWWNKRFFPDKADDLPGSEWLSLPVTGISWHDAQAYCSWKGDGYRLPTEAEWEYAARGGASSERFWGDTGSASTYAVVKDRLSTVKSVRPNRYGLYDMIGNAWEWCQDRYDPQYYRKSPDKNPAGPTDGKQYPYRTVRGGSWNEYGWNLRAANRNYGEPFRRFDGVGFRICRSADRK